ncbi:hypothetical protein [Oscillibacter sp. CAG:155]|uniref:flavodoxin family protein n=1 Tax=Oscillibacter sp. CAG:155 TaxID=1262910 RepID=UPI00033E38EF|nr:hypothetical protein [Oscillibacter sp. CAG:155]CDC70426.1 4Fe-4S binding domain protein [Oscillibacter sp. CAG:155]
MKLYEMTFSPTGGTQKAADLLTEALDGEHTAVDLTDSGTDFSAVTLTPEDVAVIAVPSYGGRVPGPATERLFSLKNGGGPGGPGGWLWRCGARMCIWQPGL